MFLCTKLIGFSSCFSLHMFYENRKSQENPYIPRRIEWDYTFSNLWFTNNRSRTPLAAACAKIFYQREGQPIRDVRWGPGRGFCGSDTGLSTGRTSSSLSVFLRAYTGGSKRARVRAGVGLPVGLALFF